MITLNDFEGCWRLTRRIEDRRAGLTGSLEGEARWQADEAGLRLTESGLLSYGNGAPMRAERCYLWRAEAGGIATYFEDGRPFHWFSVEQTDALHDCPPDTYRVRYDFADWPRWSAEWRVTGPRKDYLMQSHYSRDPG